MYTLRFPFRLPVGQAIGVVDQVFDVAGRSLRFSVNGNSYVATVEGFESENEATAYIHQLWGALMWVQMNAKLAPQADLEIGHISYTEDPVAAAENLSKSFGVKIDPPVDGLADGSSPIVHATEKRIKTMTGGDVNVTITTPLDSVIGLIRSFTEFSHHTQALTDEKLRVALELYAAYFSEGSQKSKFLTLVMSLEALALGVKRPKPILELLAKWADDVEKLKTALAGDDECLAALDSVARELIFRQESSIRSQIRALVLTTLTDADAKAMAQLAVKIYDHRSTLVHNGTLDKAVLSQAFDDARTLVERVLRARFKATVLGSNASPGDT